MGPPPEQAFPSDHFVAVLVPALQKEPATELKEATGPSLEACCLARDSECDQLGVSWKALQRQGHMDMVSMTREELAKTRREDSVRKRTCVKAW